MIELFLFGWGVLIVVLIVRNSNSIRDGEPIRCSWSIIALLSLLLFFAAGFYSGFRNDDSEAVNTPTATPRITATSKPTATPTVDGKPSTTTAGRASATQEATAVPVSMPEKPGLDGSNAYDITVSLEGMGFDIGKRQRTAAKDGYTWSVSHWTADAYYSAVIETNDDYEIYDATFVVTGDATYLPWAATLPHDQSQQESTVAWVKECQRSAQEATITVGDAVWTYKPSNGGGILRVQDVDVPAYADAMMDKLFAE